MFKSFVSARSSICASCSASFSREAFDVIASSSRHCSFKPLTSRQFSTFNKNQNNLSNTRQAARVHFSTVAQDSTLLQGKIDVFNGVTVDEDAIQPYKSAAEFRRALKGMCCKCNSDTKLLKNRLYR